MTEKRQFRAIKGTRDILPPDSALWNRFEQTARNIFESYGFGEIRLPVFEETELFARSIGADTDVVGKEMYTFADTRPGFPSPTPFLTPSSYTPEIERTLDQNPELDTPANRTILSRLKQHLASMTVADAAKDEIGTRAAYQSYVQAVEDLFAPGMLTLRPEATASVARAYIEHGMHTRPGNVKLYYIGPMFRRERPQKGRYRQFYQVGAEVLGQSDAPAIDAEVLEMLVVLFKRAGLAGTALYINSIGCKECRPKYVEQLRKELRKVKDSLGPDSQRRIETNPLRVLDSKVPAEQPIIEKLPRISDHLCADCREHFARLKEELNLRGITYQENWRLVRGLDYYTRTTFEVTAAGLGSQNAVCGGGRYDGLVELLGGPPTKGIGFAIGTDRAIISLQESENAPQSSGLAVYVAWMNAKTYPTAVQIARKLRECGLSVELPPEEMKFKKSLGLADKLGARYALIIGEDEVASKTYTLKRLADAEQKKLTEGELLQYLTSESRSSNA
ncbi:MAG TPA: histidine--tRNA ligase [Candidatus Acidoferrales bacterium]|nr:histidine--tRNA ligase [Candidatus Acidoferrales bacterium]